MARKDAKRRKSAREMGRPVPPRPRDATAKQLFSVVGIGASAGGLDAFRAFFSNMPAASGLGFVLIPHLDPTHESLMVDLLARSTAMPVIAAEERMPVVPDHVYVLPPNKYMTIRRGKLHLAGPVERAGLQTSIDLFLRSLAEDLQEQAIGILLSGTGTHGTLGLGAIRASGGMAMVQDPGTAEYDGMPRSAIATGQVDYILPPAQMPQALLRYIQCFATSADPAADTVEEADWDQLLALLRTQTKLDLRSYRKKTLLRRTKRRMGLHHIDQIPEYIAFLQGHPEEAARLAKDLLISVTSFFRDREAFRELEQEVIPQLIRSKIAGEPMRVWVPGCATGEEAYSIAMLFIEQLESARKACFLQFFASDVAEDALQSARRGRFRASIIADLSPERLARFFAPSDEDSYQVNKQLREAITFAAHNVLGDPPFSNLDLISCRNLLIYLEPDVQQRLLGLFHFALRNNGYLLLGRSETVGPRDDQFEAVSKKWRVYRRIDARRPIRVNFPMPAGVKRPGAIRHAVGLAETGPTGLSTEQLETELRSIHGQLHSASGELEGSKEDLNVANEELMSVNEEFQAANEELETSKEELQTLNEELSTANIHLQEKVEELRTAAVHLRRLAAVLTDSNDAVTVFDLQGRITNWNHGGTRIYGYTEAEALLMNLKQLLPNELRSHADGLLERFRWGERVDSLETRHLTKDGRVIDVWITGTPLRDDEGRISAVALTARDVTARNALEREVLEIAAAEQRRIGHDLHDTAGQELTALSLMADTLVAALEDHAPADVPLATKIVRGLQRTLRQVRTLSRGLVPVAVSRHGLMVALADLTARINEESGVTCTFACEEEIPVEDNTTATQLYHIAQEAVSNALKHGQPKHIEVDLGFTGGLLTMRIADDGVGLHNRGAKAEGLGLRIMRYRADSIRAILSIESSAKGGTLLTCTLSESVNDDAK
jgi:PAS domain S-box-containing protein